MTGYSLSMSQEPLQTPAVDQGFEDRWAAWQARGAAHDRATRRKLFILGALGAVLVLATALLNRLW